MGGEEDNKKKKVLRTDLGHVTCHNINQLKLLNSVLFPVVYHQPFYDEVLKHPELTRLAFYNGDHMAGAVSCKEVTEDGVKKLYIMTLGVLSAYRERGIGKALVDFVLDLCKTRPDVKQVYLHVQTNNEVAINFYRKLGFEIGNIIEDYYKNVEP
eukprot:CAMPEP_0201513406 /NCGR_PEP_ID=MMETSP0161_2-20130828/5464_1 /ASSEMBLY_ACC=CAM_ASM_000251 /TAXON_ID=180227 /ORGANISM="Neoparamoeba aestuarina, Strain SoJaBio B1-5/56/2" /LENGTH=154 /DNA_ID=CAMNT_0047909597 /DNA_START=51 /DNA_END=511 /DNA_ORIENTATION=+